MRGSHTFISLLSKFLAQFPVFHGSSNPYYGIAIPSSASRLWLLLEFLGFLPIYVLHYVLPAWLGYNVVSDRFTGDLVVWVALVTGDPTVADSLLARHLLTLARGADHSFYVTARLGRLASRSGEHPDYLRQQLVLYRELGLSAVVINTTEDSIEESLQRMLTIVEGGS